MYFTLRALGSGQNPTAVFYLPVLLVCAGLLGVTPAAAQPTCNNCVLENGWPSEGTTTGSVEQAPQVYDEAGGDGIVGTADDDLRPPQGSSAIDNGTSGNWSGRDINGRGIAGESSDIGPFESYGSALPVDLARFDAVLRGDRVRLTWTTASETGNAGFKVERRANGRGEKNTWTTVERVDGAGTSTQLRSYKFVDEELPAADTLRYRLRQSDTDGSTTVSDPVRIVRQSPTRLQLAAPAPNPATEQATVHLAVPKGADAPQLAVYDLLGRRLWTTSLSSGRSVQRLPTADLAPGPYVVRLETARQSTSTRLMVVK
jgi:hypothetical protein